jgi:hypothetical protein
MIVYQQWGYKSYPSRSSAQALVDPAVPSHNTDLKTMAKQLGEEKDLVANLRAELKHKSDEATALKASVTGIVTAALQIQPILQTGYIMPEALQQFNYFVYWAQMKMFEDQQRQLNMENEKAKQRQTTANASCEAKQAEAEKLVAGKAAADKLAADKAAAERVAAEKATAEKAAAEKAAAEKAAAEKAAAEKMEAEKAAAEKMEAERQEAAKKSAAEKARLKADRKAKAAAKAKAKKATAQNVREQADANVAGASGEVEAKLLEVPAGKYDPHAAPIVYGGSSSLALVPEAYLGTATTTSAPALPSPKFIRKAPLGVTTNAVNSTNSNLAIRTSELKTQLVQKPKPASWAGLVTSNNDSSEGTQNIPPCSNLNPNILQTLTQKQPKAQTQTQTHSKPNSTKKVQKTGARAGSKAGNSMKSTQTRERSPRDGKTRNVGVGGALDSRRNEQRRRQQQQQQQHHQNGSVGTGKNRNPRNHTKNPRRTGNRTEGSDASAVNLQYKTDIELARKLQANIDSYDGKPVEGEWQCQSK